MEALMLSGFMPELLLILAVLCMVLVLALRMSLRRGSTASKMRNRRAQAGEARAERLLLRQGFSIVDRQVSRSWTVDVDGESWEASVRADLLVEKDGRTFVAEVKTGALAPDPLYPPTRRQLLEYFFVFDPDGLLLVDVEADAIFEVAFPVA
jgi:membrane protein implicated in regulation of membrane protease activity